MITFSHKLTYRLWGAFACSALCFAVLIPTVSADTVIRSGASVSIAEEEMIEGDFYSIANVVSVSGVIESDMVAAGGQITLNGKVNDEAFLVAGRVDVHGTVGDDLRIIAGEIVLAEPVMGDVLVIGGSVNILSTASVAGDVVVYAGQATIAGSVGGNVIGMVEDLRVDAPVAGDIDVTTSQITLGSRADIAGSVRYESRQLIERAQEATVSGDLVRSDPLLPGNEVSVRAALIPSLILLFSALVWYLVARRSMRLVAGQALTKSVLPILTGFAVFLLAPIVIGVLLVSVIGTLVGVVLLFAYLFLVTLSVVGLPAVIGQFLLLLFNRKTTELSLVTLLVGVIAISLLMLLPFVGQILFVGFLLLTLGSLVNLLFRSNLR